MAFNTWFKMSETDGTAKVYIHDEIGGYGISATDFISQLEKLGPVDTIHLHINSPGGSVFDGWAMYNYLKASDSEIIVYIDGLAASMASIIAMAGDSLVMPYNTFLMIHLPWTTTMGNENDLRKDADVLAKLKVGAIEAYKSKTEMSVEDIEQMMIDETWLSAEESKQIFNHVSVIPSVQMSMSFDKKKYLNLYEKVEQMQKDIEILNEVKEDGTDTSKLQEESQVIEQSESSEIHIEQESTGTAGTEGDTVTIVEETPVTEPIVQLILDKAEVNSDAAYDEGKLAGKMEAEKELTMSLSESFAKQMSATLELLEKAHTSVFELSAKLNEAEKKVTEQAKQNASLQAKLNKLTAGLDFVSEDSEPENWKDAIASIMVEKKVGYDTAFVLAKTKYPDLYEAIRK